MKILNIMLGKDLGGIEQVFLDYSFALRMMGHHVIQVVHPSAKVRNRCEGETFTLYNLNQYDPIAIIRLRMMIKKLGPDLIITHGNRATKLARLSASSTPIMAVCHNYRFEPLIGVDMILALTPDLKEKLMLAGQPETKISLVPNMYRAIDEPSSFKPYRNPPVIGFLGRLHPRKAADLFIEALALLAKKGVSFEAVIGGEGAEHPKLSALVQHHNLSSKIKFLGWINDPKQFYKNIDIFCFPSHSEPFGLVLLEAFHYAKPVASTESEGPMAIAKQQHDILFSPVGDIQKLADNLEILLKDQTLAHNLTANATMTLKNYAPEKIAHELDLIIRKIGKKTS